MQKLKGSGVALVTPFKNDLSVDYEALTDLVNFQIENGTDYLVILGTTGESVTVTHKERLAIINSIKETNNGRKPLVLGLGGNNTFSLIEELKFADFDGIDAILSVSPYYNKPNQAGITLHYTMFADASPLPVILYNVPGRTGSNMTAETQLKLAEHPNIIGTKEASGNFEQCMSIAKHRPEGFLLISGDDAITLPLIACGFDGVISVVINAFPSLFTKMVNLALENKFEEARIVHNKLLDASIQIFGDGSPAGIKVILNEMNICSTLVRPPLHAVNSNLEKILRNLAIEIR